MKQFLLYIIIILGFSPSSAQNNEEINIDAYIADIQQKIEIAEHQLNENIIERDRLIKNAKEKGHEVPEELLPPTDSTNIWKLKSSLAFFQQNYNKAIVFSNKCINYFNDKKDTFNVLVELKNQKNNYSLANRYDDELKCNKQIIEITSLLWGKESDLYVLALVDLCKNYNELGLYAEALNTAKQALSIFNSLKDQKSKIYIECIEALFDVYSQIGDINGLNICGGKILSFYEKENRSNSTDYSYWLYRMSVYESRFGLYDTSLEHLSKAIDIFRQNNDDLGCFYCMNQMIGIYSLQHNHTKALETGYQTLEEIKRKYGENEQYATTLTALALAYDSLGDFENSIHLMKQVFILKEKLGMQENTVDIESLASMYNDAGQYEDAIEWYEKARIIYENTGKSNTRNYASCIGAFCFPYNLLGQHEKELYYAEKSTELYSQIVSETDPQYIGALHNLARAYMHNEQNDKAMEVAHKALDLAATSGKDSYPYEQTLLLFSLLYGRQSSFKGLEYARERYEILRNKFGDDGIETNNELERIAIKEMQTDLSAALADGTKCAKKMRELFVRYFTDLSSSTREMFWNANKQFLTDGFPVIVSNMTTSEAVGNLYDLSALFAKGVLLNVDQQIPRLVASKNDSNLSNLYEELKLNKEKLVKWQQEGDNSQKIMYDSLSIKINDEERELMKALQGSQTFLQPLLITWRDVQEDLKEDEVAIEFLSFLKEGSYVALTLTKDSSPTFTQYTFYDKDFLEINPAEYYTSGRLYEMVWKPLEAILNGKKKIFFSPAGLLHNMGIEYVPGTEKWEMHRLTSTRELVTNNNNDHSNKEAVLYGALNYSISSDSISEANRKMGINRRNGYYRGFTELKQFRGGHFSQLDNTGIEIEGIWKHLSSINYHIQKYIGNDGTEESFKALSGKPISIIHLATHGMYVPPSKVEQKQSAKNMNFLYQSSNGLFNEQQEDAAMTHSFLVMAGGNRLLHDELIPFDIDDGILTASEISNMDLSNTQLVVLSACETGLGDISSEGVMGLQRGFKKAGVKSIIMSLKEVPDLGVMEFMQSFYEYLKDSTSIHEAFNKAQTYMKSRYPDIPDIWASFVLLDAF